VDKHVGAPEEQVDMNTNGIGIMVDGQLRGAEIELIGFIIEVI
jgi:hypothetical protein